MANPKLVILMVVALLIVLLRPIVQLLRKAGQRLAPKVSRLEYR